VGGTAFKIKPGSIWVHFQSDIFMLRRDSIFNPHKKVSHSPNQNVFR